MAGLEHNDLDGRVIDLGTGTGRLAIGAALMVAKGVVGVDVDEQALTLAKQNADTAGVHIEWVQSDIEKIKGKFDTVIMNPPYGTWTIHADTGFLEKAFQLAPVVYSIHKSSTRNSPFRLWTSPASRFTQARPLRLRLHHL